MSVTLLQLEYFKNISETQNLSQSARNLHISTSSLSGALKSLEDEIGVQLFDRVGRNIVLNPYGRTYLEHIDKGLESLREGRRAVDRLRDERDGVVRFAAPSLPVYTSQSDTLASVYNKHAIHQFELVNENDPSILWRENLDFILTGYDLTGTKGLLRRDIYYETDPYVLVVSHENPLARQSSCRLSDLEDSTIICMDHRAYFQHVIDTVMAKHSFTPARTHITDVVSMAYLVRNNYGVSFSTKFNVYNTDFFKGLASLHVEEFEGVSYCTHIYWRADKGLTPAARDVVESLCAAAEKVYGDMES